MRFPILTFLLICGTSTAADPVANLRTTGAETFIGTPSVSTGDAITITSRDGPSATVPLAEIKTLKIQRDNRPSETNIVSRFNSLPAPWRSRDVGSHSSPGNTTWKDGTFTLSVSTRARTEEFSAFHFVYRPVVGNCTMIARVASIDNPDGNSIAGIMIADGLTPTDDRAFLGVRAGDDTGDGGAQVRTWGYRGGSTKGKHRPDIRPPYWLKLTKANRNGVHAAISKDGKQWETIADLRSGPKNDSCFIGLAASMLQRDELSPVVIDNISFPNGSFQKAPAYPRTVLTTGTELIADLVSFDQTHLNFAGNWRDLRLERAAVARIEFVFPLGRDAKKLVGGSRQGAVLRSGDFAEGKFSDLTGSDITLTSPLFGNLSYPVTNEIDALVFRPTRPLKPETKYKIYLTNTSTIYATEITASQTPNSLTLHEPVMGDFTINLDHVASITPAPESD
ncbi:MAG: hypothetical protein P8J87_04615 [Verrucomicrobiales bacterium]|nr:hypothetical protein [Verrucomicrobiales bacterium]